MTTQLDVVYGARGDRRLRLDVYQPDGDVNHGVGVLVYHGGGWSAGDRKMLQLQCASLAARGFTALAVEYRFVTEAKWPAQLADVKTSIRWAVEHAEELCIDPARLVLEGHSAGAQMAMIAAGTYGKPDLDPDHQFQTPAGPIAAVVAYYPPVRLQADVLTPDLTADPSALAAVRRPDGSIPAALLLGPSPTTEAALAASPLTYVGPHMPPTIVFHGTDDSIVAESGSVTFYDSLRSAGVPCELHLVAGADHAFDATPSLGDMCATAVASFLYRYVVNPVGFGEEAARHSPIVAIRRGSAG